jgi:pyruvate formate lyase activating enzyme
VILRIPLIHDFNDSTENIESIYELASELKIGKIDFLPYHRLGEKKYERLEMDYKLKNIKPKPNAFYLKKLKPYINKYPEIKTNLD